MIRDRVPRSPQRLFERSYRQLVQDVKDVKRANPFQTDNSGRFRIGDVYITQTLDDDGTTIHLTAQNANTEGPPVVIGILP